MARQILEPPGSLVNQVTFKPLGFLNGESRQYGQIQPISGDTFQVGGGGGGGGPVHRPAGGGRRQGIDCCPAGRSCKSIPRLAGPGQ